MVGSEGVGRRGMPVPAEPRVVEDAHGEWSLTERLLRLPHELAGAEQPEDLVEAAAAALSQLLGAEASVYWADEEPHPPAALSPHRLRLVVQPDRKSVVEGKG